MKRALYFAIRTAGIGAPVIAVTTEKQHRWHGREVRGDMPTHGKLDDLRGRFEHVEEAYAMQGKIRELAASYDAARKVLSVETSRLYGQQRQAMEALLKGEQPPMAKRPTVTFEDGE